jgi:hypothetical protein
MFQRIRIAGRVLPGNLWKIHSQDLPSFLYTSKRCSSRSNYRLCLLVLERPYSPLLEHPLTSLLDSESLLLKLLSLLLLDCLLLCDARAPVLTALSSWGRVYIVLTWLWHAPVVVNKVVLLNVGCNDICRLKPVKRYEYCSIGLIVKSIIFPTWPVLIISQTTWLKETPRLV